MQTPTELQTVTCQVLPDEPDPAIVYRLLPVDPDDAFYQERTDRNIGWITRDEQDLLRASVIGIAGCGGMGGLLASTFIRAGVGEVRISDCETFDISNINRQFGASRQSVGESKAFVTARLTRAVTDDATLAVYPQGITEETVDEFVSGCDVVCDEIEALALPARILLHQRSRAAGVSLFNCNSVGCSTNLFLFTPDGMTMEAATGISYAEALELRARASAGDLAAVRAITDAMLRAVVPHLPDYAPSVAGVNSEAFYERVTREQKIPILATNPVMAAGFLANRILLYLLRNSGVARCIPETPPMPAYLHIDSGFMAATIGQERT